MYSKYYYTSAVLLLPRLDFLSAASRLQPFCTYAKSDPSPPSVRFRPPLDGAPITSLKHEGPMRCDFCCGYCSTTNSGQIKERSADQRARQKLSRNRSSVLVYPDLRCVRPSNDANTTFAGATAVLLGRPMFFSLAVGGQEGVQRMLNIIKDELEAAMALCGCQVATKSRNNSSSSSNTTSLKNPVIIFDGFAFRGFMSAEGNIRNKSPIPTS